MCGDLRNEGDVVLSADEERRDWDTVLLDEPELLLFNPAAVLLMKEETNDEGAEEMTGSPEFFLEGMGIRKELGVDPEERVLVDPSVPGCTPLATSEDSILYAGVEGWCAISEICGGSAAPAVDVLATTGGRSKLAVDVEARRTPKVGGNVIESCGR